MATPEMAIVLSSSTGPLHIVTSDQIISGKVIFPNKKERPMGIVTISLLGTAETTFSKGRTIYNGKATLFHLSKTLYEGLLPQNQNEWPFEFTFPTITGGEKKKWLAVAPFQVTEGHQLPPSMISEAEDFENNTGKAAVVYMLESTFCKSPKSSKSSPLESTCLTLYHIPHRNVEVPDPKIAIMGKESFTCTSKLLDPTAEKTKSSFFKRTKTPRSIFEVSIATPHIVYVGGPLDITLSLAHDLQNSTVKEVSTVRLTSCTVTLLRTMHTAGKAIFEDDGKFFGAELYWRGQSFQFRSRHLKISRRSSTFQMVFGLSLA